MWLEEGKPFLKNGLSKIWAGELCGLPCVAKASKRRVYPKNTRISATFFSSEPDQTMICYRYTVRPCKNSYGYQKSPNRWVGESPLLVLGSMLVLGSGVYMHMQTEPPVHVSTFCHFSFAWKLANHRYHYFKMAIPLKLTNISQSCIQSIYSPICSQGFRRFWAWSRCPTWCATSG